VAGRQVFEIRVLSPCHLFALCAMADFSPPPCFSPMNNESDEKNVEGVTIIRGEISYPFLGFEIVPCRIHVCVDPDPDTTTAVSPPLPGQKSKNPVQLKSSLSYASSFSQTFVYGPRVSSQPLLQIPVRRVRWAGVVPRAASRHNLYEPRTFSTTPRS